MFSYKNQMKPILLNSERYEIKVQIKLFFSNFAMQLSEMCVCESEVSYIYFEKLSSAVFVAGLIIV